MPADCPALRLDDSQDFQSALWSARAFDRIEPPFDIVPMAGMVAVFHPQWTEIVEGRYYVIESQHPPGGMSWAHYDDIARRLPEEPRTLLKTSRRVVKAIRRPPTAKAWWHIHENGFADGPILEWAAGHNVVGEVVGIYRP